MKYLYLTTIFICIFTYSQKSKDLIKVSTNSYGNSQGINLDIYYPLGWEISSAKRPHILFNAKNENLNIYSTLSINDILENAPENVKKSFKELGATETQNIIFSSLPNKDNCRSYDFNQGMENISEPICSSTKIEGLTNINFFFLWGFRNSRILDKKLHDYLSDFIQNQDNNYYFKFYR